MRNQIVILHGWANKIHPGWKRLISQLRQAGFRVYFPRIPGLTGSPLTTPWRLADYAEWLAAYIRRNQMTDVILAGHSFGGSIAISYALRRTAVLRALVLINSAGIRTPRLRTKVIRCLTRIGKVILRRWLSVHFISSIRTAGYRAIGATDYLKSNPTMKVTLQNIVQEDLSGRLAGVSVPTLLIWGGGDHDTPLSDGQKMNRAIPGARLVIVPEASHNLPLVRPQIVSQHIREFIHHLPAKR